MWKERDRKDRLKQKNAPTESLQKQKSLFVSARSTRFG